MQNGVSGSNPRSSQKLIETKIYFKTWTATVNGVPPTGGGGGTGKKVR
jgi:galacturan 1,4-alpha-galacturonidase